MAIWTPNIDAGSGPAYRQIADAIAEDIASGTLPAGTRLPPHRILAYAIGVSPSTTSRAYAEAVARGLVYGEVGRGTYTRPPGAVPEGTSPAHMIRRTSGPIDFAYNLPTPGEAARFLAGTLATMGQGRELQTFLDFQRPNGLAHHTAAAIDWFTRTGVTAHPDEIVVTVGGQHGLLAAMSAVLAPGEILAAESLCYPPIGVMAERLGLRIAPVAVDRGGLSPDDLARACKERRIRAVYVMPTLQTPTTITMDAERRSKIIEVAHQYDLMIIEDDVFGMLKPHAPKPLVALAPERALYISSVSKCLTPGLRVGYVKAPASLVPALHHAVKMSCWMPPPIMVEIASRWILDGTADHLIAAQRSEARERQKSARSKLRHFDIQADPDGLQVWLRLPTGWSEGGFCAAAAERGVDVSDGSSFSLDANEHPRAIRIALGHEPARARVDSGLEILRALLEERTNKPRQEQFPPA